MKIAVSELQPSHGDQQLVSYPNSESNGDPCNSKQQTVLYEALTRKLI